MPSLPVVTGIAVFAAGLLLGRVLLDDPDPYWQITVGRWILAHQAVPTREIFAYTMAGAPWVVHEWLAEVIDAVLYDAFGWAGLVVAASLCLAAAIALLVRALLRYLEPIYALIGAVSALGLTMPHALARPHLFAMPILAIWIGLLVDARQRERAPPLPAALLMVLWANLHGGFLLGVALAAMFAGEMLLDQPDWPAIRRQLFGWVRFLALCLVAGCVTPNGIAGFVLPFRMLGMATVMANVTEWQSPNFQLAQPLEPWLMLALLGILTYGPRLPVTRTAMLLVLLHMALAHRRFAEILGIATPLLVAPALAGQLPSLAATGMGRRLARLGRTGSSLPATALAAGVILALAAIPVSLGIGHESGRFAPAAAVAYARAHGLSGPVLNSYNFGGYLIFAGIPPYIDSRAELYGNDFIKRDRRDSALPELLTQYHVAWTLLEAKDDRNALLDHMPGWRRVYGDDIAVIHVREGTGSPEAAR